MEDKADTQDNALLGSDEGETLDAQTFKERIAERRKKLLQTQDKGSNTHGGSGPSPQNMDSEYSVGKEGKNAIK